MAKYKISKENINEFFGLFGKKNKPKDIDTLIKNDPILNKLDKEIEANNKRAADIVKTKYPDAIKIMRQAGIEIK